MRAYVMTTGVIFGLLVLAHVWRMFAESMSLATDPFYLVITVVALLLSLWAARLLLRSRS
jgi:predicted Co/Zn/Cd cation transporter (cation efflux family)